VTPIENLKPPQYDKEKYKEMILDATETVFDFLAFIGPFIAISREQSYNVMHCTHSK
jgi:hypothetical protein